MKPEKVLIPIGEHSTWCRAIPQSNGMPLGITKKLKIQGVKDSIGEYLLLLLMQGYLIHMVSENDQNFIEAISDDFIRNEIATDNDFSQE